VCAARQAEEEKPDEGTEAALKLADDLLRRWADEGRVQQVPGAAGAG
jgi:hypothetical protein